MEGKVRIGERRNGDDPPLVLTYTRVAARDAADLRALVSTEPALAAAQDGKAWRSNTRELSAAQAEALAEKATTTTTTTTGGGGGGGRGGDGGDMKKSANTTDAKIVNTRGTVGDLALVDAATGARATSKGVHDRLRKIRGKVVELVEVETRLLDGLDHIEATALQGLPAPVNVDGVAWTATEAPEPEELMEVLKGPKVKRMAPPVEIVLVGGGDGGTAAMMQDDGGDGDSDGDSQRGESVAASDAGDGGGGKKGGKKGKKGAKGGGASKAAAGSGQEPGKAAKKLKAAVKAARKKGLGPIAKAAGLVGGGGGGETAETAAGGGAGVGTGASKAGVRRRAPPAPADMHKLRSVVLTDWREQAATVEVVSGPGVVVAGTPVNLSKKAGSLAPIKTGKGAKGFASRQDARGGMEPRASMGRVSMGSQAAIV